MQRVHDTKLEHWHLIRCHTGMALHAAALLMEQHVPTFVPKRFVRERIGRQAKIIVSLRLPGNYGFVMLKENPHNPQFLLDQAGLVAATRGVSHLYTNDRGRPTRIPHEEVRYLQNLEAQEISNASKPPSKSRASRFEPGETITVVRHEYWAGYEGEVLTCIRGIARIVIGNVTVTVPDCDIERSTTQALRNSA